MCWWWDDDVKHFWTLYRLMCVYLIFLWHDAVYIKMNGLFLCIKLFYVIFWNVDRHSVLQFTSQRLQSPQKYTYYFLPIISALLIWISLLQLYALTVRSITECKLLNKINALTHDPQPHILSYTFMNTHIYWQ